ncbi:hypothetical protein [Mesoflavibacter sp. CH_XMU1422-2]|uniref:hypothetical protein n=1 Tax=Mesoflavibacter sp. CH_XMU1422-2 TaxID=3107770 RepID=UPI00300B519B
MKKLIIIFCIIFFSCGTQNSQIKLKTIKDSDFSVQYPNNWDRFGSMGYVFFRPKELRKIRPDFELNSISLSKNPFYIEKFNGVENTLNEHGRTLRRGEINKEYVLTKLPEGSKYIYKIESTIERQSFKEKFKRLEFFYVRDSKLDYIEFHMEEKLFDKYFDDAMLIINSFEPK